MLNNKKKGCKLISSVFLVSTIPGFMTSNFKKLTRDKLHQENKIYREKECKKEKNRVKEAAKVKKQNGHQGFSIIVKNLIWNEAAIQMLVNPSRSR